MSKRKDGVAMRVTRTTDVVIRLTPRWLNVRSYPYGSPEYWAAYRSAAQAWCDEFEAFLRDHRSQDSCSLEVERQTHEACSECGHAWEVFTDDDGVECCAGCGRVTSAKAEAQP